MLGCRQPEVMPECSHQCSPVLHTWLKTTHSMVKWHPGWVSIMHYAIGWQVGSEEAHDCSLTSTSFTACLAKLGLPASSVLCA